MLRSLVSGDTTARPGDHRRTMAHLSVVTPQRALASFVPCCLQLPWAIYMSEGHFTDYVNREKVERLLTRTCDEASCNVGAVIVAVATTRPIK